MIDGEPLDHPHGCRAIAGRAVDERRLVARGGERREDLVGDRWIRRLAAERDAEELDAGGLRGRGFGLDVGARLGRQAQVDDRRESELLDLGHALRLRRAAAGDRRFEAGKIRDARDLRFSDLLCAGRARERERQKHQHREAHNHG